jgi:hypothetical protein
MLGDNCVSSFRYIDVWFARGSLWHKDDRSFSVFGVVSKPFKGVINVVDFNCLQV